MDVPGAKAADGRHRYYDPKYDCCDGKILAAAATDARQALLCPTAPARDTHTRAQMAGLFFRQLGALFRKNWIVLGKHPIVSIPDRFDAPPRDALTRAEQNS